MQVTNPAPAPRWGKEERMIRIIITTAEHKYEDTFDNPDDAKNFIDDVMESEGSKNG